jgi:hypothetical protein
MSAAAQQASPMQASLSLSITLAETPEARTIREHRCKKGLTSRPKDQRIRRQRRIEQARRLLGAGHRQLSRIE